MFPSGYVTCARASVGIAALHNFLENCQRSLKYVFAAMHRRSLAPGKDGKSENKDGKAKESIPEGR
jgi:hypothetical protein